MKNQLYFILSVLLIESVCQKTSLTFKSTKKFIESDTSYVKVLRSHENMAVYQDFIKANEVYEDQLNYDNLMDDYYNDGIYYQLDEFEDLKSEILVKCKTIDENAEIYIPDEPVADCNEYAVTTIDNLYKNIDLCDVDTLGLALKEQHSEYIEASSFFGAEEPSIIYNPSRYDVDILNILVPGVGGSSSHWSNDGFESNTDRIYISTDSLPYQLSQAFDSEIYVANANQEIYQVTDHEKTLLKKFKNLDKVMISNGSVILYEDIKNSTASTDVYYNNFKDFMLELWNYYPNVKFNLYGHSRGGAINLFFATEYKEYVNQIFSLGTPYYSPVLSNVSSFINNLPGESGITGEIKSYLRSINFDHNDAFASLADEQEMKRLRQNRNNSNDSNLHTIGYGFGLNISIFIRVLWWTFRIDIPLSIPWDILVGADNAMGNPSSSFNAGFIGLILELQGNWDYSEPLENNEEIFINIDASYIIDVAINNKTNLCSDPDMPAVPHNLETMHPQTIRAIMNRL